MEKLGQKWTTRIVRLFLRSQLRVEGDLFDYFASFLFQHEIIPKSFAGQLGTRREPILQHR